MEQNTEGQTKVIVGVFTPYLCADIAKEGYDDEYVKVQKEKFSYEDDNLNDERLIVTPRFKVKLDTHEEHESRGPGDVLLAIHGSTREAEERIRGLRGTGLIVARYSIFYGGPSKYTGNYPEESGYSLDIPKKVSAAKALVTDDGVFEAILSREEKAIVQAIYNLNKKLEQPILVTPYLPKALADAKK